MNFKNLLLMTALTFTSTAFAKDVITISGRGSEMIVQATNAADHRAIFESMKDCSVSNTKAENVSLMLGISCYSRVMKYALDRGYRSGQCGTFTRENSDKQTFGVDIINIGELGGSLIVQATNAADNTNMLEGMKEFYEVNTNITLGSTMLTISSRALIEQFAQDHGYQPYGCVGYLRNYR